MNIPTEITPNVKYNPPERDENFDGFSKVGLKVVNESGDEYALPAGFELNATRWTVRGNPKVLTPGTIHKIATTNGTRVVQIMEKVSKNDDGTANFTIERVKVDKRSQGQGRQSATIIAEQAMAQAIIAQQQNAKMLEMMASIADRLNAAPVTK